MYCIDIDRDVNLKYKSSTIKNRKKPISNFFNGFQGNILKVFVSGIKLAIEQMLFYVFDSLY